MKLLSNNIGKMKHKKFTDETEHIKPPSGSLAELSYLKNINKFDTPLFLSKKWTKIAKNRNHPNPSHYYVITEIIKDEYDLPIMCNIIGGAGGAGFTNISWYEPDFLKF